MRPLQERLGQTVRALRVSSGFSQESFGAAIAVHRTCMSNIERGRVDPRLKTLQCLARGLRMAAWQLLLLAETIDEETGA
jgi:DNA-binding XRE family transcriptional regulator